MRLIDADELTRQAVEKLHITNSLKDITDLIDRAPTIDPNELDLDIDYSIEYDKRPDGISNAKVTITRIKPRDIIACEKTDELDMLERMYTEPSGDLVNRQLLIGAIEKCGEDKIYPQALIETIKALPSAETSKNLKKPNNDCEVDLISRQEAIEVLCRVCGWNEDGECTIQDVCKSLIGIKALPSADVVSKDMHTEEQSRFVAKETELAHIEARLENAEKKLQGVCVANFIAEQLDRLKDMTDEERWNFFIKHFSPSADRPQVNSAEWVAEKEREFKELHRPDYSYEADMVRRLKDTLSADRQKGEWIIESAYDTNGEMIYRSHRCSVCGFMNCDNGEFDPPNFCSFCGADMRPEK